MTGTSCPDEPDELTAEWCTAAMHEAGTLAGTARIASVACAPLGDVRGYFSRMYRLDLTFAGGDGPATIVAKLPSSESWNRMVGFTLGMFDNELRFYRDLSTRVPMRVPTFHGGAVDVGVERSVLLLEDVSGGRQIDQSDGCRVDDAADALRTLAELHRWRPAGPGDWPAPLTRTSDGVTMGFDLAVDAFLAGPPIELPPEALAAVASLRGRVPELVEAASAGASTIVHGDFRLDNLVFDGAGDGGVLVFDWQNVATGNGFVDVAQLLCLGLTVEDRRAEEDGLLLAYRDAVGADASAAREGYRLGALLLLVLGVGQTLTATDQSGSDVGVWLERSATAVADLGMPAALA